MAAVAVCDALLSPSSASAQAQAQLLETARKCFGEGRAAYTEGRLNDALTGFLCAYRSVPSPELAWNLGRVYERMKDASAGIRYYALFLESDTATSGERKDVEARIAQLSTLRSRQTPAIHDQPPARLEGNVAALFARGVKLFHRQQYAAALAAFAAALKASAAPEVHYNLAVTSERLGQLHEALDHYHAYVRALPQASDKDRVGVRIEQLRTTLP